MKISKKILEKISRKVNRDIELEAGRNAYGRVHKSKKAYDRKKERKNFKKDLVDW